MADWKNKKYIAEYAKFKIGDEKNKYRLSVGDYMKNSTVGDSFGDSLNSFQSHNNMAFSTFDSDNDMRFYDNCAQLSGGAGWWFNACFQSNLNGVYYHYTSDLSTTGQSKARKLREENSQLRLIKNGIHWNAIDFYKSLKTTKLRIKRNENIKN